MDYATERYTLLVEICHKNRILLSSSLTYKYQINPLSIFSYIFFENVFINTVSPSVRELTL